ncbi:hypothetical protein CI109_102971 [Kwoniella shandongensis]|uniref:Sulfhydryl oxidase n=1 Tax=Kwoniella shandongensis TaxID=1734106 RepID=A0A5M6C843_9TREE|nr:uncharacterized protein CI109_000159 [Kwoniella shandongensis]KAA5531318.1 hypothetical protein CI109_000159 [Kwoniella shandongensis]
MTAVDPSSSSSTTSTLPRRTTKATHPNLPPGLILDENGKVCKVCNSWQDWGKIKKKGGSVVTSGTTGVGESSGGSAKKSGATAAGGMAGFAAMMSGPSISTTSTAKPKTETTSPVSPITTDRSNCPPDTALLGRSTWTFLHTTAAYYPLQAPPQAQSNMINLLSSLSLLYPCSWCATDFQKDMRRNPPDVTGREGLMKWLCERHNEVNTKLGKDKFDCGIQNLDKRWKDGPEDGSCD